MLGMNFTRTLLLALGLVGCGQDEPGLRTELFAASCAELQACNCDDPQFTDADECARVYAVQYADIEGTATVLGLKVDTACFLGGLPVTSHHCATYLEFYDEPLPACSYCAPVHGDVVAGEACVAYDGFSDCAQGLRCAEQRCVDPCDPGDVVVPCDPGETCPPGFYCGYNGEGCRPTPQIGDPCWPECGKGLVCEYWRDKPVCGPMPEEGERCYQWCAGDLKCIAGVCGVPPKGGEPCPDHVCDDDSECDWNTLVCQGHAEIGESCGLGQTSCVRAAYCNYDVGRCEPDHELGGPCGFPYECIGGLRCAGEPPVCSVPEAYICER